MAVAAAATKAVFSLANVDLIGFLMAILTMAAIVLVFSRLAFGRSALFTALVEAELESRLKNLINMAREKLEREERQRFDEQAFKRTYESQRRQSQYSGRTGKNSKRARNPPKGPPPSTAEQKQTGEKEKERKQKQKQQSSTGEESNSPSKNSNQSNSNASQQTHNNANANTNTNTNTNLNNDSSTSSSNKNEGPAQSRQPQSTPQKPNNNNSKTPLVADAQKLMAPIVKLIVEKKQITQAIDLFDNSIANNTDLASNHPKVMCECLATFGQHLVGKGVERMKEAVPYLQRAHSIDPENPQISLNLGIALYTVGRHAEAMNALEKAVRVGTLGSRSSVSLLFLGKSLISLGRASEAVIHLKHALKMQQKPNFDLTATLANAYVASGEVTDAIELVNRFVGGFEASKMKPKNLATRTSMIRDLLVWMTDVKRFDGKRRQEHRPLIEKWVLEFCRIKHEPETNISPMDFSSIVDAIDWQQDSSFDQQTLKLLERCVQLFGSTHPRSSYNLSRFLRSRGQPEKARIALVNSLAVAHGDDSERSKWIAELQELEQQLKKT